MNSETDKQQWLSAIFDEYPLIAQDTLKRHYIENLLDCYIHNSKKFKELTYQAKNEKCEPKQLPTEIFCISKIDDEPEARLREEVKQ